MRLLRAMPNLCAMKKKDAADAIYIYIYTISGTSVLSDDCHRAATITSDRKKSYAGAIE